MSTGVELTLMAGLAASQVLGCIWYRIGFRAGFRAGQVDWARREDRRVKSS